MTVQIAFQGGTHGNFLRYFLDRFSTLTPTITETPFKRRTGTSHNKQVKYSGMFERCHPHLWGWPDNTDPHIVITIEPKDVLWLQRMNYIRPADRNMDMEKSNIVTKGGYHDFQDNEAIEKLYGIEIVDSLPRFILRDFCKLGFSNIRSHGLMTVDKTYREKKLDNAHYFPVSAFWNQEKFFEQIKIIDEKFKLKLKLDAGSVSLHNEFIEKIPELNTRDRCAKIIDALKNQDDVATTHIDLIEQAYINSWIETTHKNILAPFTNDYFKTTKEILEYIRWYPHFYHGMNPTLPKNIG